MPIVHEQQQNQQQQVNSCNNADSSIADSGSMILASKAQLRLDQQLKASGSSVDDVKRNMKLHCIRVRDVDEHNGDSENSADVQNDDNVSFSGSIESTDDGNIDVEQVIPPSSSTSLNIVPVRLMTDFLGRNFKSRQENVYSNNWSSRKGKTGNEEPFTSAIPIRAIRRVQKESFRIFVPM
jgi:hypothetical protein